MNISNKRTGGPGPQKIRLVVYTEIFYAQATAASCTKTAATPMQMWKQDMPTTPLPGLSTKLGKRARQQRRRTASFQGAYLKADPLPESRGERSATAWIAFFQPLDAAATSIHCQARSCQCPRWTKCFGRLWQTQVRLVLWCGRFGPCILVRSLTFRRSLVSDWTRQLI